VRRRPRAEASRVFSALPWRCRARRMAAERGVNRAC
jgi:hypothetical protein